MRFMQLCVCAVFILGGLAPAVFGQEERRLELAQNSVRSSTWASIKEYFASLRPGGETTERSRLLLLQAQIIEIESEKQKLIEIINDHFNNSTAGAAALNRLRADEIPMITGRLTTFPKGWPI